MVSFGPRNVFYLRINAHTVLPVFLHLDEQNGHAEWMTEAVLQQVVEDLRPLIGPKIRAEDAAASTPGPAAKKTSGVDVYRGSTYQFGYYLQKAEHHSLLIKSRNFAPMNKEAQRPPSLSPETRPQPTPTPDPPQPPRIGSKAPKQPPRRGVKRRRIATSDEEELSDRESGQEDQLPPNEGVNSIPTRRSQRSRRPAHTYKEPDDDLMGDVEMDDGDNSDSSVPAPHQRPLFLEEDDDSATRIAKAEPTDDVPLTAAQPNTAADPFVIDEDEDTDAKKMQLNIRYEGFSITSWRLCLIVQPYPPLPRVRLHPLLRHSCGLDNQALYNLCEMGRKPLRGVRD
ncbi:hypothetical protein BS47DRAFT_901155 [Hydnum rufescens UP504]|uniref:Uncharacterized protein n=1 Tax=Hydnum rufescens UP504 TaxID=1448309 RepID=A0A9P6DXS4_9AGAM|nr:hypothetical protein BS47DRAFT_901155 [Hydnum rufescens UP504]